MPDQLQLDVWAIKCGGIAMFGQFFDTSAIDAFAAAVAADLLKTLPPAQCESDTMQARKWREKAERRVAQLVAKLVAERPLNFYQKASLGVRLQDALEKAGYPANFAKPFAYDVVSQVAKIAAAR